MNKLMKIPYDYKKIKLENIFTNSILEEYESSKIQTENSKFVFGDLKFPISFAKDRPYTISSFVTSIDGKIAFLDAPEGPFIAQKNFLDPVGADADFWILNLMRANADGIIVGAGTMRQEPDMTAHVFDVELESKRVEIGKQSIPYNIISSLDGNDIPFDHMLFKSEVPIIINTSPKGFGFIKNNLEREFFVIEIPKGFQIEKEIIEKIIIDNKNSGKIPVIVTGEGRFTDTDSLFKVLKYMGIDILLVESPSYVHHLISEAKLDEVILNYSTVYIGGNAIGLGNNMKSFSSENHPHTEILSLHMHSPSFLYFRHKFNYNFYKG
ncbi:RibD family protein [Cetobacterium sp.]|uniref:RibD family protein n=1 Tax=Cetobacterium sp. TaxID=2071632 RepID=UPI003EE66467